MRLDRLKIDKYKNLKNISVDFDQDSFVTVLIGQNGSGKSNLIEALVEIFTTLDLNKNPPFKYELKYECRDAQVEIDADPSRIRNKLAIHINGEKVSRKSFKSDRQYLPSNVFGYYSGDSQRLQ